MSEEESRITFLAAVPQFNVQNLVRTAEYYRDTLGFQIAGYWDGEQVSHAMDNSPLFAILCRDYIQVFFNQAEQSDARAERAEGVYDVYFRVTGVDALASELLARGAEVIEGPESREYGQRELVVKDCNGLLLVFGEATSSFHG